MSNRNPSVRLPEDVVRMIRELSGQAGMRQPNFLRVALQHWWRCSIRPRDIEQVLDEQFAEWREGQEIPE